MQQRFENFGFHDEAGYLGLDGLRQVKQTVDEAVGSGLWDPVFSCFFTMSTLKISPGGSQVVAENQQ